LPIKVSRFALESILFRWLIRLLGIVTAVLGWQVFVRH
jgi:hypothetical protein